MVTDNHHLTTTEILSCLLSHVYSLLINAIPINDN